MTISLLLATAFAQDLTLTIEGDTTPGSTVDVTIEGLVPGEMAYLGVSDRLGETCPASTAPFCTELVRPRVLARGAPPTDTVTVRVTLPNQQDATHYLQAISPSGVSAVQPVGLVIVGEGDPAAAPPLVVGVAITCDTDQADVIAQYMGDADGLTASAWLGGVKLTEHALAQQDAPPGSIFFDATAFGAEAPTCADLTWVVEATNPSITTCVVRGDESESLRSAGAIAPDCADI